MTVRHVAVLLFVAMITSFAGVSILVVRLGEDAKWSAWFYAVPFIWGIILTSLRCPRCRHHVFKHEAKLFGVRWTYWSPEMRERCIECGFPFGDSS